MEKSQKNNKTLLYVIAGAALVFSATSLTFSALDYFSGDTPITFNNNGEDGNSVSFTDGSIEEVVSKVSPSVVSILTETRTTSWYGQSATSTAAGSGMIISGDGYILTNKHVISGANNIDIILDDGTTYEDVQVVATDPLNDVAFLKIRGASDLPAVTLGDSKTLNAGQQVVAIGNALGQYSNSVTFGVISGTGRSLTATDEAQTTSETLSDMIQTDAAINAGNSGGPLVNAAGQVIGINTATTASGNDIGFAIPISSVKGMLNQVLKGEEATRSYIGVYTIAVDKEVAQKYDLTVNYGALVYYKEGVSAVMQGSPAAQAGIKDGDVILSINGTKIGSAGSVGSIIGEYAPGDTVQLEINRGGQNMAINVTLGAYQAQS